MATLTCKDCQKPFHFPDAELEKRRLKLQPPPSYCRECRDKRKSLSPANNGAGRRTQPPLNLAEVPANSSGVLSRKQDDLIGNNTSSFGARVDSPAATFSASQQSGMDMLHKTMTPIQGLQPVFIINKRFIKLAIPSNTLNPLPTPLSISVDALQRLQKRGSDPDRDSLFEQFNTEVRRIAHYFSWVSFMSHPNRSKFSAEMRRGLAGWNPEAVARKYDDGDITLLTEHGTGVALNFASLLTNDLVLKNGSSPFILKCAEWFLCSENVLRTIVKIRNTAAKISRKGSWQKLQRIFPELNARLEKLSVLSEWVLIGHDAEDMQFTALVGSDASSFCRIPKSSLDADLSKRIYLNPFLQFLPSANELHIFDNIKIGKATRSANYLCLPSPLPTEDTRSRAASNQEIALIAECCPVEKWNDEFSNIRRWNDSRDHRWNSQQYEFVDVLKDIPNHLYQRDEIVDVLVKSVIDPDNKDRNVILIKGEQGVGKTALVKILKKRLTHERIHCIPYFFIWNDDRLRCELTLFIEAAILAISSYRQSPLDPEKLLDPLQREKLLINLLQEKTPNVASITTLPTCVVFVIDGLDILHSRNPEAVSQLLTVISALRNPLLKWICLSQPLPDEFKTLHSEDYVQEFTLNPLTPSGSRELLENERSKKAAKLPEADRLRLLDNDWIESALSSPDAGKPSYLLAVLNQVASGDSPANSQLEGFRRLIERLAPDSLEILALLAIVYAPISDQDIAAITFAKVDEVRTTLLEPCFRPVQDRRWSIKTYDLRDYIVKCDSFDLPRLRKRALQWLIQWALNWENSGSLYALEFLPQHLQESTDTEKHDELRRLASSSKFLDAQRTAFPYRPGIPVNTIYRALVSSCKDTRLVEMFLFALRHAEVVSRVSQPEMIAIELQSKNYRRVSELAKVPQVKQERIIWQLLAAIGAWTDGDFDAAQAIIYDIELPNSGTILRDPVAVALGHLASEASGTTLKVDNIIPKVPAHFLSDNGKLLFFQSLSSVTDGAALLQALPALEELQKPAIIALARAIGRSGSDENAQNIANTYPHWADDILIAVIGGFLEVGKVKRAHELLASISAPRRVAEESHIRSAELRPFAETSIQLTSASSAVGTKDVASAARMSAEEGDRSVLLERLIRLLPRTHSEKEKKPEKWGKPRVVGEIAAALLRLDDHSGHRYFSWAENSLKEIGGRWHKEIAWGLVDLAQARLSLPDDNAAIEAETWIRDARLVLQGTKNNSDRFLYKACETLAEAWSEMEAHCIPGADEVLNEAHRLAKLFGPSERVYGLVEIARRAVRLSRFEFAKETLAAARTVSKKGGAKAQARYLDGLARCGILDRLEDEIVWFARDRVRDPSEVDDPLEIVGRAEVERRLRLADFAGATAALELIGQPDNRAKASRSIAVEYATHGRYDDALRMVRDEMRGGRRGEQVPGVAHAVAMHARENPDLRGPARAPLKQLLVESAGFLDGTYRVVSYIIASQAFPELDPASLLKIAEFVVGDVVFVDEGARKQL